MLDKFAIARALREIAALMTLKSKSGGGDNPWKARAYENGARALEEHADDLGKLVDEGRLTAIRGVGEALAGVIEELYRQGSCRLLDQLRAELPAGVLELSPVVGPKKALALVEALGVRTVAELKQACDDGRVAGVKGFGQKTASKILASIDRWERRTERVLLSDALEPAERLVEWVRQIAACELAGDARRACESVSELVLVAASDEPDRVIDHLVRFPSVMTVESREAASCTVRLGSGMPVELHVAHPSQFGAALVGFTGSAAHLERLHARGLTALEGASEEAIYRGLGLPFIPPEQREGVDEVEQAGFEDLLTLEDVRGMVHCHTTWSDGKHSIEEMARAADRLGLAYLTITDHSPSAYYASGVGLDRLKAQWDEIARVQEMVKVRLLRGTESDILADGALDYPDPILEQLDVVIASIHSRFQMGEDEMTRRIVTAMKQPVFKIWGHPLGRLVLKRDPIACRVEEILDAAASSRAAVEINGDPHRLDLEPRWIRAARERKLKFVVSVDAHSVNALGYLRFAVAMARRGGVRRQEVLNTLPADAFARAVHP